MKPFAPPPLPWPDIGWEHLIPAIGRANRALSEFNGILYGVPNPEILLSPMTTQEAVLSSKIEGTQATLDDVLRFESGDTSAKASLADDIQEVLNYRHALREAVVALKKRPFNLNLLKELHATLLSGVRGADKARGRFRPVQNWIGRSGTPIEKATFVPPSPDRVLEFMDGWEKFYHAETPDPLVQLAMVHAQFELIHPFLDGNGRLGRILIPLFLAERGVLARPMFYLSSYLELNRSTYMERLRDLSRKTGAWTRWIEFFLVAVEEQATANTRTARAIMDLYQAKKMHVIELTRSPWAMAVLDHLFQHPIISASALPLKKNGPSRQALSILIAKLKEGKILKTVHAARGRRAEVLVFAELVNLCEGRRVF